MNYLPIVILEDIFKIYSKFQPPFSNHMCRLLLSINLTVFTFHLFKALSIVVHIFSSFRRLLHETQSEKIVSATKCFNYQLFTYLEKMHFTLPRVLFFHLLINYITAVEKTINGDHRSMNIMNILL